MPEEAPGGLLELLARAGELPDFATLDRHLRDTQAAVRAVFGTVVGEVRENLANTIEMSF